MTKLEELIEKLDKVTFWCQADVLNEARRLALEEAKECPDLPCYHGVCVNRGATEPLAVLADRKGVSVEITPPSFYQSKGEPWDVCVSIPWQGMCYPHEAPTYAAAEQAARAFLEGLADKGETK